MTAESTAFEITIHQGTLERRVPLIALAAALRLPRDALAHALGGLLLAYSNVQSEPQPEGEPTEGERSLTFPNEEDKERSLTFRSNDEETGARGDESTPDALTAEFLAGLLDDEQNLPALRLLVTTSPPHVLSAALAETLAVPDARIRRSRAAYFTAAVRRRSKGDGTRPSSTPYA